MELVSEAEGVESTSPLGVLVVVSPNWYLHVIASLICDYRILATVSMIPTTCSAPELLLSAVLNQLSS